jgi:tRNA (adenine22-N1)-methyltransferase
MKLADRLLAIASLVPQDAIVADIGSDHGLLLDHLLNEARIKKGYATDNKPGPNQRLLARFQNEPRISVYQADGLIDLPTDVDAIVIAGMGGLLINRILAAKQETLKRLGHVILSPHQQVGEVRLWMMEHGFRIDKELVVCEDGQYYDVMRFVKGSTSYSEAELLYGPLNLARHDPTLIKKMKARLETVERLLMKNLPEFRIEELLQEKEWLKHYDQDL